MMPSFRSQPLQRQLLIAIALLLVPVVAAAGWSGLATLRERETDLRQQGRIVASAVAAYVNNEVEGLDRLAADMSNIPEVRALDPIEAVHPLEVIAASRPQLLDIILVDPAGEHVAQVGGPHPIFADHRAEAPLVLSAARRVVLPMRQTEEGTHYLCVGYPLGSGRGEVLGALWFLVSLENMQETISRLPLPEDSVVTVTDAANIVLMRNIAPEAYVGKPLHGGEHFADGQDWTVHAGTDGIRRMYVREPLPSGPWTLSVGIPMRIALAIAGDVWTRSLAILAVGLAGWVVVAVALSRRLSVSVQHLDSSAQRIAAGDFAPLEPRPMPSRELEELQSAFALMLQRFNETREQLDRHLGEERKIRQELQSLERQVIRQERLAAVGQLVSGVAHEINNPLQAILGFSELLQMQRDLPESAKADLRLIQKESARACAIIRNLALFARQQPGEATAVSLIDVVNAVAELRMRRLQSENIELTIEDKASRPVLATVAELQQVALNFLVNAEQAIKLSGRLPGRITMRTYDADQFVGLEVEDTGPGVPAEHEAKLFQPFFTTKPVGQGTGLGLSVSYGVIESLGGRIGHRPAPAGGAIFYFELPPASHQG